MPGNDEYNLGVVKGKVEWDIDDIAEAVSKSHSGGGGGGRGGLPGGKSAVDAIAGAAGGGEAAAGAGGMAGAAAAAGPLAALLAIWELLKKSAVFTGVFNAIMDMLGAMLDILLVLAMPLLLPILEGLAAIVRIVAAFASNPTALFSGGFLTASISMVAIGVLMRIGAALVEMIASAIQNVFNSSSITEMMNIGIDFLAQSAGKLGAAWFHLFEVFLDLLFNPLRWLQIAIVFAEAIINLIIDAMNKVVEAITSVLPFPTVHHAIPNLSFTPHSGGGRAGSGAGGYFGDASAWSGAQTLNPSTYGKGPAPFYTV